MRCTCWISWNLGRGREGKMKRGREGVMKRGREGGREGGESWNMLLLFSLGRKRERGGREGGRRARPGRLAGPYLSRSRSTPRPWPLPSLWFEEEEEEEEERAGGEEGREDEVAPPKAVTLPGLAVEEEE